MREAALLRRRGIPVAIGHRAENLGDAAVVVTSTAVRADNPEVLAARAARIPVVPRALMLAELESPTSVVVLAPALAYDGWAIPWVHSLVDLARWIPFSGRYQYVEREPYGLKNTETRAMIKRMLKSQHVSEVGAETLALDLILQGRKLIAQVMSEPERIHSPILFMHAVDDESVHVRNPERIYGQVSSKEKEFIYLGDSYHMITIDNERDLVRKESLRFIKTAVNRCTRQPAFEMPHFQSYELRRQLQAQ